MSEEGLVNQTATTPSIRREEVVIEDGEEESIRVNKEGDNKEGWDEDDLETTQDPIDTASSSSTTSSAGSNPRESALKSIGPITIKETSAPKSTSTTTAATSTTTSSENSGASESAEPSNVFDCNICLEQPEDPVITMCGHLFCWACLYKWLELHPEYQTCPVCKAGVTKDKVIPLYGRGKEQKDPRTKRPEVDSSSVPRRPQGQRTEPTHQFPHPFQPFFPAAGPAPFASTQFGNFTFSAGFGMFPSLLGFQVYNSGFQNNNPRQEEMTLEQQQQAFLSRMLFMLGTAVVVFLLLFN